MKLRIFSSCKACFVVVTLDWRFDLMNTIVSSERMWICSPKGSLISVFSVIRAVKNFHWSPITTMFQAIGHNSRNTCSISSGAIFSPPAVIISSLIQPVISRKPSLSRKPKSPLCTYPYESIVSQVAFSLLMYPTNIFHPLKQTSPIPFESGFTILICVPGRAYPHFRNLTFLFHWIVSVALVSLIP